MAARGGSLASLFVPGGGRMIGGLLLLVLVAIGVGLAVRRMAGHGGDTGGGSSAVRRFFQYLVLYGLLVMVAIGLSGLLARLFSGAEVARFDQAQLARSLTFVLIGGPLYAGVALWVRRQLAQDPAEVRSLGWALYATVGSITALVTAMVALHSVLSWIVDREEYDGRAVASLLVWGVVWAAHWLIDRRISPARRSQVHQLAGSLIGLGVSAGGLIGLLGAALEALFGTGGDVLLPGDPGLLGSAVTLVVGAPVWLVYWLTTWVGAERTPLWLAYVFLFGVGGGLVGALSAAGTSLFDLLVWVLGDPSTDDLSRHFSDVPSLVAAVVVGLLVWWYHRSLLAEATGARSEVRRIYEYLVAGIGLLAASIGLATLLVAFLEAISGTEDLLVEASAVNTLLGAVTALVIGGPVWWIFWRRIQGADPAEERASPTRRVYLFVLFGVGGVAAVIALIVAVFIFVEDVLEGTLGAETVRSTRFTVGILAATGAVATYHWAIYRADRRHTPGRPVGPRYVLLIGAPDDGVGRALAHRTGGRVRVWPRTDVEAVPWSVDRLMEVLEGTVDEEVVVISDGADFRVIPIDRP